MNQLGIADHQTFTYGVTQIGRFVVNSQPLEEGEWAAVNDHAVAVPSPGWHPPNATTIIVKEGLEQRTKGDSLPTMNQTLAFGLTIRKSRIHGKGCFAAILFRQNQQIAEYVGERISMAEAERRRCISGQQCICDVDAEWAIDGSRGGNGTQYVNHSCQPNSDMIVLCGQLFHYALRDITPGEEITTEYLYELGLEGTGCNCRTGSCRETINLAGMTGEAARQVSETPARQSPYLTLSGGGDCEG